MAGGYMLNRRNPASLYNHFILELEERGNRYLPIRFRYQALTRNTMVIEKASRGKYRRLTPLDWDRYLVTHHSRVYIPITDIGIHWSIIEAHGHDRIVELLYIGCQPIGRDTQLNFQPIAADGGTLDAEHPCFTVACRASKLDTYSRGMYYRLTDEEAARDEDRYRLVGWRSAM